MSGECSHLFRQGSDVFVWADDGIVEVDDQNAYRGSDRQPETASPTRRPVRRLASHAQMTWPLASDGDTIRIKRRGEGGTANPDVICGILGKQKHTVGNERPEAWQPSSGRSAATSCMPADEMTPCPGLRAGHVPARREGKGQRHNRANWRSGEADLREGRDREGQPPMTSASPGSWVAVPLAPLA